MAKEDLTIAELKQMQKDLFMAHPDWQDMEPQYAKDHLLYMVEELGECISIIKKKKINQVMENPQVRARFVEEFSDVLMYYTEVLNRLEISSEELSKAYIQKHDTNMNRNYAEENKHKYV